jgi:hypothetical protein
MYKYLVVGVTVSIIFGAGYYLRTSGGAELIGDAYAQDAYTSLNPTSIEAIPGVYFCDTRSGCVSTSTLVLKDDNTLDMLTIATSSYAVDDETRGTLERFEHLTASEDTNSQEGLFLSEGFSTIVEKGTWDVGNNNMLIIALTGSATTTYDVAKKIVIQHVSTSTLSRFTFNRLQHPTFRRPIFLKQQY